MIIIAGHRKGGVGKTFTACSLAAFLAGKGSSVLLVDMDKTNSSREWSAIRDENGTTPPIPCVSSSRDVRAIVDLSTKYDAVIVDVGANDVDTLAKLAKVCDLWLLPTDVGQAGLSDTHKIYTAFREADDLHKDGQIPIMTFLSRSTTNTRSSEPADARAFLLQTCPGITILESQIAERAGYRYAGKLGLGGTELTGDHSKAANEMKTFFNEVFSLLNTWKKTK
jgi:chromosome partitioning protein